MTQGENKTTQDDFISQMFTYLVKYKMSWEKAIESGLTGLPETMTFERWQEDFSLYIEGNETIETTKSKEEL